MSPTKRGRKPKNETVKVRKVRTNFRMIKNVEMNLHQWIRFFSAASVLLMLVITLTGIVLSRHYREYPGKVERDTILCADRGSDFLTLQWEEPHNVDVYHVYYKVSDKEGGEGDDAVERGEKDPDESWAVVDSEGGEARIEGLQESTRYSFIVRGDNENHKGHPTSIRSFMTKKQQTLNITKVITKLSCSEPFRLDAGAKTEVVLESSDPEVATISETGEVVPVGEGVADITVHAKETSVYEGVEEVVELRVIETEPVSAGGASAHVIYHLDADNCEVVKAITGSGGAVVPQGLGYTGDKYIVSYGMGNPNRIISFDVDGDGKDVSVPAISLGHPNGFTYADENGRCYCVRGWSSKAVTYEPTSGKYDSVTLPYGCSGIGYDRKEKLLYTCSRTAMVAYDISAGYEIVHRTGVVRHSGYVYTQDCGGYGGIMMRCLSGSNKHGTNYIDLYDMRKGTYLGSFSCDLSEVESAIVDKDGFLEILANNTSGTDYIWKTQINMDTLSEGIKE
jgi:hypothetical protein